MTKDEFDALEEGDEIDFGGKAEWQVIKKDPVFTWISLDGTWFVDKRSYQMVPPPRRYELAKHMGLSVPGLFGVAKGQDILRPAKPPPKISDYPHVCDCGSPAFAGFFSVDCKAKCAKPNVRNI